MKVAVTALLLLLLCTCHLQAALTKRQTPAQEPPPAIEDFFSQQFQTLSDFMTKDLPQKLQVDELQSQAKAYVDRAKKQLAPLAQEIQTNFFNLYSWLRMEEEQP